jgi:hypothetical protein
MKMGVLSTEEFLIPNVCGSLVPSLKEILEFVGKNVAEGLDAEQILFKVKIIVTELLNNALKHVKNSKTFIRVSVDDKNIHIIKQDIGSRLVINDLYLCQKKPAGQKVQISQDSLNSLYAIIEGECQLKFICEESTDDKVDYGNLLEHFGLLIITKTASEFTYTHNPDTFLNTFDVLIHL